MHIITYIFPNIGVRRVKITHKDKEKPCRIFVVLGEGPELQVMLDIETLELLRVSCNTIETSHKHKH